jgi:hypothetical protein
MKTPLIAAIAVLATSLVTGASAADAPATLDDRVATLESQISGLQQTQTDSEQRVDAAIAETRQLTDCLTHAENFSMQTIWVGGRRRSVLVAEPDSVRRKVIWLAMIDKDCIAPAFPGGKRTR